MRARPAYRSSSYPGHWQRVRREPSRTLVGRVGNDARRHYWKWRQEVCAFPRQCGAAVEGSSECGSGPCRPALPGRRSGSRRMTPVPATRPASNSRAATAAEVMLVFAAVPGEGLGTQRIKGTSPEIPTSHGAAVEPNASGHERTWPTRTPGWRHPTTHTTRPADAIGATAPHPVYGPPPDSAPHTVGARAPRGERGQGRADTMPSDCQPCEDARHGGPPSRGSRRDEWLRPPHPMSPLRGTAPQSYRRHCRSAFGSYAAGLAASRHPDNQLLVPNRPPPSSQRRSSDCRLPTRKRLLRTRERPDTHTLRRCSDA